MYSIIPMNDHAGAITRAALLLSNQNHKGVSWSFSELKGKIIELSEEIPFGALTFASELILEAQQADEPVAWISARPDIFYPPDMAQNGIDVTALSVISVTNEREAVWVCDLLIRSGAFGFVVVDIESARRLTDADVARLVHLSRRHSAAVLFLTVSGVRTPALSSLVSLRGVVRRPSSRARAADGVVCEVITVKDKRGAPGGRVTRKYDGPIGLC